MEVKKQLCCDLDNTQYFLVEQVCVKEMNMRTKVSGEDWDLKWTDDSVDPKELIRMKKYQKINHFPGMYAIGKKRLLAMHLGKLQKIFPDEYDFFPKTWTAPIDKFELKVYLSTRPGAYFIVKPEVSLHGRGIFLTRNLDDIDAKSHLVQEYISTPYLINDLKFDIRLYVLVTGCDPLRVFVYNEGIVRFATEQYSTPNNNNYTHSFMHISNFAINRESRLFINNVFAGMNDVGQKRTFSSVLKYLQSIGKDTELILKRIDDMIVKTLLPAQPSMSHYYHVCQPEEFSNSMCFEVLGFDIILDEDLNPRLLEVNSSPSFGAGSSLDSKIKRKLIFDVLKLVHITVEDREKWDVRERFVRVQRTLYGSNWRLSGEEKTMIKEKLGKKRTDWENANLGDFRKVFPVEDMSKYENLLLAARDVWEKFTGTKEKRLKNLSAVENKKSLSVTQLNNSKRDIDEVCNRLSQPPTRKVKTKILPKVIYHHAGSNILKLSPSSVTKIELLKKGSNKSMETLISRKNLKMMPDDVKAVYRKRDVK